MIAKTHHFKSVQYFFKIVLVLYGVEVNETHSLSSTVIIKQIINRVLATANENSKAFSTLSSALTTLLSRWNGLIFFSPGSLCNVRYSRVCSTSHNILNSYKQEVKLDDWNQDNYSSVISRSKCLFSEYRLKQQIL